MWMHVFVWLQSVMWRIFGRKSSPGTRVTLVKKALAFYDTYGPPVSVEPEFRIESRHSTSNILTRSELVRMFYDAQDVSPWVLLRKDTSSEGSSSTKGESSGLR
jgi:hypothetical protein